MNGEKRDSGYFRLTDLFIIIVFLSIAAFSIDMFRRDLLQTINLQNVEPVGTVVIKRNTVQRRISDRVLWDRLARESPVYIGDLIRVANISAATLYIDDNSIDIDENTLIRISRAAGGEGLRLVLSEGALSLAAGTEGRNVSLDLNGVQVQAARGSVLSAGASGGGISVQVNEGNAQIVEAGGTVRGISSGSVIAVDAGGTERPARAAVVTRPVPNARYVKPAKEPLTVNFSWNRVNLASNERLRLEIAADRNFNRVSGVIENLNAQAQAQIDTGFWHWRLSFDGTVLATGSLTVADGSGPELQSPAFNSLFRYRSVQPLLNFQWARVQEAVSYIVEVSRTADFSNPQIRRQSYASSMTVSALGEGTWFWRVMPVFPSVFSGSAVFSTASFFRIERISAVTAETSAAQGVSLSQWLTSEAPSKELPPDLPPEIIPQRFIRPSEPPTPSLLPAPQNLRPRRGTTFGLQELRSQRAIVFSWFAVWGANAYIFTLYQQTTAGRRQIVSQTINSGTRYTLADLHLLDRGTFVWQVEAVNSGRANAAEQRGTPAESTFIIDFPSSAPLQIENTGILYGN